MHPASTYVMINFDPLPVLTRSGWLLVVCPQTHIWQVIAVSHKWVRKNHPDPDGNKLAILKEELKAFRGTNAGVFVDFYCMKQHNTFRDDNGQVNEVTRDTNEEKEVR